MLHPKNLYNPPLAQQRGVLSTALKEARVRLITLILAVLTAPWAASARAEDWPKWLGPEGTGISKETGLLDKWPANGPRQLWSAKVGEGYSSPIAFEGKVYLFAQDGRNDTLTAFNADTGKVVWQQSNPAKREPQQSQGANSENGLAVPQATPTIDAGRIYTYSGGGDLVCREIADGKEVWRVDVLAQTHSQILTWACASSPLITDRLVYVQTGEDGPVAVAVDKKSGTIAWKSQATAVSGYAAPILAKVGDKQHLIIFGGDTLFGIDPDNGNTIWSELWATPNEVNACTPIYRDSHLFITSNYGQGCAMYMLSEIGVKKEWESKEVQGQFQPCILDGDHLYANSGGTLKCVHWPDGKPLWSVRGEPRLGSGGSILLVGNNRMITLSDHGKLSLVDIQSDGAKLISEVALFDDSRVWALPLVYHGKVYAKGREQLVCLDIAAAK